VIDAEAAEAVYEATRDALEALADLEEGSQVRAVVVLMDVDGADGVTRVIWRTHPRLSVAWAHGLFSSAAYLAVAVGAAPPE